MNCTNPSPENALPSPACTDSSPPRSAAFSGSLRTDPSSLFSRASVATVALVNAVVMAGSGQVHAQSATPAREAQASGGEVSVESVDEVHLSEVVVTGQANSYKPEVLQSPNYTAPILDVPQTVNVIPEAVIKEQGATTMREVLRNVPGISMQGGEGGFPTGDSLTIRGFSARTDYFVDGIRDFASNARDPFNIEQVEVAKGPSSASAGYGTTGGSINIVSKTPKLDRFYGGEVGIGTDHYKRFTLDLNQPIPWAIPGTAFRVNALWTNLDVPGRDWVENTRWGVAPSLAFGLGTDTRLILSYFHYEEQNVPDYGIPWVPTPRANQPNIDALSNVGGVPKGANFSTWYGLKKLDNYSSATDMITVEFEHDFNEAFSLQNVFRWGQTNVEHIISAPRFATPHLNNDVSRSPKFRDQTDSIFANKLDFTAKFDTFNIGHTVNFGMDFAHEQTRWRNRSAAPGTALPAPFNHPNAEDHPPFVISHTGDNKGTMTSYGLYFAETLKIHEKFDITGGVRWDHSYTDYEQRPVGSQVGTYLDRNDDTLSWRVGGVFKPVKNGSIYLAYGTSFNPSGEAHTLSASTVDLDPEETRTIELGTKWDLFENRLSVNASIFRIEKTNARTQDPLDPNSITTLAGKQRVDGFEISLLGAITDKWQVITGYSYINSEIVSSNDPREVGYRLVNTPQQTFTFWTTYNLPWNFTVGAGAQYVGTRYNHPNAEPNVNQRIAPDYWLFDGMVSYKISENMTARLNVYNIADEKYVDRPGSQQFVPGAGRSGTLSLAFSF